MSKGEKHRPSRGEMARWGSRIRRATGKSGPVLTIRCPNRPAQGHFMARCVTIRANMAGRAADDLHHAQQKACELVGHSDHRVVARGEGVVAPAGAGRLRLRREPVKGRVRVLYAADVSPRDGCRGLRRAVPIVARGVTRRRRARGGLCYTTGARRPGAAGRRRPAARGEGAKGEAMQAKAAISYARDWRAALDEVLAATDLGDSPCDLALFFASAHYSAHYDELVPAAWRESGARALAGCSGQGVIGPEREIEGEPAMSLLRLAMPGATVRLTHVTHQQVEAGAVARLGGVSLEDVNAWLVLADPFRMDPDALIRALEQAYPGVTIVGGLASSRPSDRRTYVCADDTVYDEGAVAVALGGNVIVRTVVSQGATPIGQPWTITGAHDNVLETIGGRPAYQVLVETVQALPADVQQRAVQNLLVGLAIDEY